MTFFNLPDEQSPLQFLSRNLGSGIGTGIQQKLETARMHKEEEHQKMLQEKEMNSLQDKLNALGSDASALDKFAAIAASPTSDKTKSALQEALRFEGAKDFAKKVRENEGDLSIADILEGQALGFISPGSGQELLRTIGGTREREGAAKIYTPSFQATQDAGKKAREGIATVRRGRELLNSGKLNFGPLSLGNIAKWAGIPGAGPEAAQEFTALTLGFLTGEKARFGVRLTDADLKIVEDKLPAIGRTKEGNEALLNLRESEYLFHQLESQAQQKVLKENKGFTYDFQEQVDKELENLLSKKPEIERLYTSSAETLKRLAGEETPQERGETFESLPPAAENEGEYFKDVKSGQVYKSNGKSWKKV